MFLILHILCILPLPCLQGSFLSLVPHSMPFTRDPANFTDPLSRTFPPFVHCEIALSNVLVNRNTHRFGCHLHFMEYYEKIFVFVWFLLAFFWLWSALITLWLSLGLLPVLGKYILVLSGGFLRSNSVLSTLKAVRYFTLADIHALYLVKHFMGHVQFKELMEELSVIRKKELEKKTEFVPSSVGASKYTVLDMEGGVDVFGRRKVFDDVPSSRFCINDRTSIDGSGVQLLPRRRYGWNCC